MKPGRPGVCPKCGRPVRVVTLPDGREVRLEQDPQRRVVRTADGVWDLGDAYQLHDSVCAYRGPRK